jgi:hypothetical protein
MSLSKKHFEIIRLAHAWRGHFASSNPSCEWMHEIRWPDHRSQWLETLEVIIDEFSLQSFQADRKNTVWEWKIRQKFDDIRKEKRKVESGEENGLRIENRTVGGNYRLLSSREIPKSVVRCQQLTTVSDHHRSIAGRYRVSLSIFPILPVQVEWFHDVNVWSAFHGSICKRYIGFGRNRASCNENPWLSIS